MGCPLVSVVAFLSFCKLCHAAGEVQSQIQSVTIVTAPRDKNAAHNTRSSFAF